MRVTATWLCSPTNWGAFLLLIGWWSALTTEGWVRTHEACAWTGAEVILSILCTAAIGMFAAVAVGKRSAALLDLGISRGLEVAAALPIVLACAVLVAAFGWRLPVAVAVVVGIFNGLRCLRLVTVARLKAPRPRRRAIPLLRHLSSIRHAVLTSALDLVPQLVVVEASIEFLGFFRLPLRGGVGQQLGVALSTRNTAGIVSLSLMTMGATVLVQRLLQGREAAAAESPGGTPPNEA